MKHYIHMRDEQVSIGPFNSTQEAETFREGGILWIGTWVVDETQLNPEFHIIPPGNDDE